MIKDYHLVLYHGLIRKIGKEESMESCIKTVELETDDEFTRFFGSYEPAVKNPVLVSSQPRNNGSIKVPDDTPMLFDDNGNWLV